jgi:hypothetical protein
MNFRKWEDNWKLTEEAPERGRRLWTGRNANCITIMIMMVMVMLEVIRAACFTSIGVLSSYLQKESR